MHAKPTTKRVSVKFKTHEKYSPNLALPVAKVNAKWRGMTENLVARITKKWFMVVCNECVVQKYDRDRGYSAGAFRDRMSLTPNKILNFEELNAYAELHGGTWDSGWKPRKEFLKEGEQP